MYRAPQEVVVYTVCVGLPIDHSSVGCESNGQPMSIVQPARYAVGEQSGRRFNLPVGLTQTGEMQDEAGIQTTLGKYITRQVGV